jgi:hypothetical protein
VSQAAVRSAADLAILPVATKDEIDLFIRAAEIAQGHDRNWVMPLHTELQSTLKPEGIPFTRSNPTQAFVAMRGGKPVGRIMAIEDKAHLARHKDATGHFGFVEAIDDDAVWDALFDTARGWLRVRGLTRMEGPYNASINHEIGLLVEGFDTPPLVRTTHAQPYYARQFERAGLRGVKDVLAYEGDITTSTFPARVAKLREKWTGAEHLTLWHFDVGKLRNSAKRVNAVFNDAWSDNWRFVPVPNEEAIFIAKLTKPILKPDWTTIAEWKGEPVGVLSLVPDINEAIADLGGKLFPFGWSKLLWRLRVKGTRRARIPLIGVRKKFRGTRIGSMTAAILLADAVEKARAAGVKRIEISWMLDDNEGVLNLVESLPTDHSKTWRIYAQDL